MPMRFRHCTAYHLAGIQDLPLDPWTSLVRMPLAEIDTSFAKWVSMLRLDGLELSVTVTGDQGSFAEVDTRMAIGNQMLDGLWMAKDSAASPTHNARYTMTHRPSTASAPDRRVGLG